MKRTLGTLLAAFLVVGCTSGATEDQPPPVSSPDAAAAEPAYSMSDTVKPAWRTKLAAVGQPVVVDGVALVLAQPEDDLKLVALELATGRELWRKSYDATAFARGSSLSPVVVQDGKGRDLVVLRRPMVLTDDYSYSPLQAVLPRTGKVVGETGRGRVYYACETGPGVCLDGDYYYSGSPIDPGGFGPVTGGAPPSRWDPLHPRRDSASLGGPDATFRIGSPGIYATRLGTQRILRLDRGELLWSKTMSAAFGPHRTTTDRGWSIDHLEEEDVLVGSLGYSFPQSVFDRFNSGRPVTYSLDEVHQVFGLDASTGERLWRIRGADPFCALALESAPAACVLDGRVTEQQEKDIRRRGLTARLVGFEPATGEETWSIDLDRRTAQASVIEDLVVKAPDGVVVGTDDGRRAVDLADGSTAEIPDDVVTFCSDGVHEVDDGGGERNTGTLMFPCTADGKRSTAPVTEWGVATLPETEGLRVVSVAGRVIGYRA